MFSKLKNKLKNWTSKISKEKEISENKDKNPKKQKKEVSKSSNNKSEKSFEYKKIQKKTKTSKTLEKQKKDKNIKSKTKLSSSTQDKQELDKSQKKETEENSELLKEPLKEKSSFFKRITQKTSQTQITEKEFETYQEELEMILLENNVAFEVVEKIISQVKSKIVGIPIPKKEIPQKINESLKNTIKEILVEPFDLIKTIKNFKSLNENKDKPYVILFCGINGSGKTTGIAKLASKLQENKFSVVLAAADTFRAASIEQLKIHSEKLNSKMISHEYGSDPASVGFDAIKYAEKNKIDIVLIDTAGRMHTEKNLIQEIEKISRVCKPNLKIFVGESITGNDATEQAKSFNNAIEIDAIILTKADIDEKAGTVLSVGYTTGKPIIYLGTGQNYKDLEIFDKENFIEKLELD